MKRGPAPQLPSEKMAKGTFQPCRDDGRIELVEPDGLPHRPEWLTPEGEEVWIDDVGRVAAHKLVSEKDTTLFASYCNLMGAQIKAWRSGEVPPISAIAEARKMAELFGIAGKRSRVKIAEQGGSSNPFARNGHRG